MGLNKTNTTAMASIADLNVRLGLIYKDFDKGMEQVKRRMRKDGRELSNLGDQLTVAVSLPLAAAGAAAGASETAPAVWAWTAWVMHTRSSRARRKRAINFGMMDIRVPMHCESGAPQVPNR